MLFIHKKCYNWLKHKKKGWWLIKARSKKETKKEIILADNIWADIDAYCKYAGIGGTIGAKRSVFIEEAAKLVFSQDEGFEEFKRQAKTQKKGKKESF